jgi:hypothetical protein
MLPFDWMKTKMATAAIPPTKAFGDTILLRSAGGGEDPIPAWLVFVLWGVIGRRQFCWLWSCLLKVEMF